MPSTRSDGCILLLIIMTLSLLYIVTFVTRIGADAIAVGRVVAVVVRVAVVVHIAEVRGIGDGRSTQPEVVSTEP